MELAALIILAYHYLNLHEHIRDINIKISQYNKQ